MAKRNLLTAMARGIARAQRKAQAEANRSRRWQERAARQAERVRQQQWKAQARAVNQVERAEAKSAREAAQEARQRYLEERAELVDTKNEELTARICDLQNVLEHTLSVDDTIAFDSLRIREEFPPFTPPSELTTPATKPQKEAFLASVRTPNLIERNWPGFQEKYRLALREAESRYEAALGDHEALEADRKAKLEKLGADYESEKQAFLAKVQQRDQEVQELEAAYRRGDPSAVVTYNSMVLERSEYPDGFPQEFRLAYLPESKELVIEYELPSPEVIPSIAEYVYVKSKDTIQEKARKPADIKELYQDVVASVAIRSIHEVFEADQGNHLQVVVFNGLVQTVDPATGKDIRPCLVSVRVTRERFGELDLRRIDKRACLRNLGAQVSPRPAEMQAVKPIIEFDMVDKRFVEQGDILAELESRPNLMELTPFGFENLVSNLFHSMGLETRLTRASRDGGVDVVAFDTRPVVGGKVVIQAKRYSNTVGVSAVRDLYGTMMNEGANKGILVTTSSYGPDAYDFAADKPIELIDGGGLLYLLENHAGVKARIIFATEG